MFYIAKILELTGLTIIALGVIISFPNLMNPRLFLLAFCFFIMGILIEKFSLEE